MPTRTRKPSSQSAQSHTRVTRTTKSGQSEHEEDLVDERMHHQFDFDPAYVRVGAGVTRNLGNYESLRVDVAITMPCHPDDVDDTFTDVAERVSDYLNDEVDEYLEDRD